ncbi:MAG: hydrogenase maturation protease [Chloroflexi bacterium CFX4]|nr:hydrogenase maturation protease [Chloroflexi bacterium CFX4]MDL1921586.1 hydrogenase maturation protease [Chloroflexi bacterium CFX3]
MPNTVILALGNPLRGDDGVGAAVLEQLGRSALPKTVALLDGGTVGLALVLLLNPYQHAIIIDAAAMGEPPGTWRRFSLAEVCLQAHDMALRGTLHYAGLAEALLLGEALNMLPPQITIFGIQPAVTTWEIGLSNAVQAAVPSVCTAILELLNYGENTCH